MMNDSNYNNYAMSANNEPNKIVEFLKVLQLFSECTYEEKVAAMHELWGEIEGSKTVFYGDKCKVTITKSDDGIFHFAFDVNQLDMEYVRKTFPMLYDKIFTSVAKQREQLFKPDEPQQPAETSFQEKVELLDRINDQVAQMNLQKLNIKPKQQ